jgi:hypothetical protein
MNPFAAISPGRKQLVFLGANDSFRALAGIYNLKPSSTVALADPSPSRWGRFMNGFIVRNPKSLRLSDDAKVVCLEPMRNWLASDEVNYPASQKVLSKLQVKPANIAFVHQPGRAHRFIAQNFRIKPEELSGIGRRLIYQDVFQRCNYAYGLMLASEVGRRMQSPEVSVVETGVWFGAGLLNICEICDLLTATQGTRFRIFGLDTGEGLPEVKDWRDHPELWATGSMVMPDHDKLRSQLPANAELILGDVATTVPELLRDKIGEKNPIGFLSLDVDLYTASVNVLKIFDAEAKQLAPVVPVWVDDSNINIFQGSYCGEALAIREFNECHATRKIDHKIVRTTRHQTLWHHCFYFAHIFDSPYRNGFKPGTFADLFHTDY